VWAASVCCLVKPLAVGAFDTSMDASDEFLAVRYLARVFGGLVVMSTHCTLRASLGERF
jgi:hypothetical protein